ncbi:MAG: PrpR N-terminal domain-containing protein [Defluviitaleaceae bacterium]|nr:PrpR N-terminal domain-containing protein [Defluviitaleaceae bacterium]
MVKIACLFPRQEMLHQAEKIAENYRLNFLYMKVITTKNSEAEADAAVKAGADVIIARGNQATLIANQVSLPVIELRLTEFEMAQLILRAKTLTDKLCPVIGVISFANMMCDLSKFSELYNITLREYYVENSEGLISQSMIARDDGVDILIGGDIVCQYAEANGIPSVFFMSGAESIAEAFRTAERVSYAINAEKKNSAELKTLLDYSFCGIVKIDSAGVILHANYFVEKLLGKVEQDIVGCQITDVFPTISNEMLELVLVKKQEVYSTVFMVNRETVVSNFAPIIIGEQTQGAILSFNEGETVVEMEQKIRREVYRKGYIAYQNFDTFVVNSSKELVEQAKSYARFSAPVLILGQDVLENGIIAECIHNYSFYGDYAFVNIACDVIPQENFAELMFGIKKTDDAHFDTKGLVDWAEGGTLFLSKVSCLDLHAQSLLFEFIKEKSFIRKNDIWRISSNVRIIASDTELLANSVANGEFHEGLYYALSVLPLMVKPLHTRPNDIRGWLDRYIDEYGKMYQRYIKFTEDAYKIVTEHSWNGGLTELRYFCERIAILSKRRTVNGETIRALMNMSPSLVRQPELQLPQNATPQEIQLRTALQKYHGRRQLVANEMGISLSTLWRYMKKYGIKT